MQAGWHRVLAIIPVVLCCCMPLIAAPLEWQDLPELPEPLSGHASGVHNNTLLVAGGSNFQVSPFQGGSKIWRDGIHLLTSGAESWQSAGTLPTPRAYAGVVSHGSGIYIIGGSDGTAHYTDSLRLEIKGNSCVVQENALPPLPEPFAFGGATLIGDTIFIVGGIAIPDATQAHPGGWKLNLSDENPAWTALPPLPSGGVILPVVCGADDLFVISGASLAPDTEDKPVRTYMHYGWRLKGNEWHSIADAPTPFIAAPAMRFGAQGFLLIVSGDDGSLYTQTQELGDNHPGFPNAVWAYHPITDTWSNWGESPVAYVTTNAVEWTVPDGRSAFVIPGGEDRPGHRATRVAAAIFSKRAAGLTSLDHAVLVVYFLILVGMGVYFSKREKSTDAFFLGGRKIPWWAVGISIFGTSLSAITYLSIPAMGYASNWVFFLANIGIVLVAPFVVIYYLPKFRSAPITTAYEYLELRFNLPIRIYGSLCFMSFQAARVGIVLLLPAMALSAATGINVYYCILAMGVLATLYTVLGGIEAVIWTDVLQAIVLVFGALLTLGIIVSKVEGGFPSIISMANEADKFHTFNWTWDYTTTAVWVVLIGNAFASLYPYTADQTIVQRYLTTPDERSAARAIWVNALLTIPITLLFFSIGTALWAYFKLHPDMLEPTLKNDATLPLFVISNFPSGLKGLLIAAIFAASMSSLDSSLNSISSVITTDYYRRFSKNVTEKSALRLAKMVTLLAGAFGTLIATYMASLNNTTLWEPFIEVLGLVGGGLSGVFALGVFTKRTNGIGAVIGVIACTLALFYAKQYTGVHPHLFGPIGFLTAFLVGYFASFPFSHVNSGLSINTND